MASRARIVAFGSAALAVIAGAVCAIVLDGVVRDALALALILAGLGAAVLLAFLEVGLSEERDRARQDARLKDRQARNALRHDRRRLRLPRPPRRPG